MSTKRKSEQLPLHLPLEVASAREDLIVTTANQQAVTFLDNWPEPELSPIAILAGPVGAGKTHLAHIWAARMEAKFLPLSTASDLAVPQGGSYVVEDLVQGAFSETWLFHLINTVRSNNSALLLTSRRWPGDWGIALPDLQSRIKLAHLMELNEPDDALLAGVLMKLFSDRQLHVEAPVIDYLVQRMERSLASAQNLVFEIDGLSLAEKRGVTKQLAGDALRNLGA
ncbi:MAG: DnaA/Hda family protein [Rhizobiaceae bacterium]